MSGQTKEDLVNMYNVPAEKIAVTYQSCDAAFEKRVNARQREDIRAKYNLPQYYFLSTGSVIERKDLLTACKAIAMLPANLAIPLVVIGSTANPYAQKVKKYLAENKLEHLVIFLNEHDKACLLYTSPSPRD